MKEPFASQLKVLQLKQNVKQVLAIIEPLPIDNDAMLKSHPRESYDSSTAVATLLDR